MHVTIKSLIPIQSIVVFSFNSTLLSTQAHLHLHLPVIVPDFNSTPFCKICKILKGSLFGFQQCLNAEIKMSINCATNIPWIG